MFPLHFHYEDVSRQDPLLKPNHANVMDVPGLCEIRVVPKAAPSDFIIQNGKLAMEIPCGQNADMSNEKSCEKHDRLPVEGFLRSVNLRRVNRSLRNPRKGCRPMV